MTKDSDFVDLAERLDAPPKIIWLTCRNISNIRLKEILSVTLLNAIEFLEAGEKLVEISAKLVNLLLYPSQLIFIIDDSVSKNPRTKLAQNY